MILRKKLRNAVPRDGDYFVEKNPNILQEFL